MAKIGSPSNRRYKERLSRRCVCGRTFGNHGARAPHTYGEEDETGPACRGFREIPAARSLIDQEGKANEKA